MPLLLYVNCRMSESDLFDDGDEIYCPNSEEETEDEMEEVGKGKQKLGKQSTHVSRFYGKRNRLMVEDQLKGQKHPVEERQRKCLKISGKGCGTTLI